MNFTLVSLQRIPSWVWEASVVVLVAWAVYLVLMRLERLIIRRDPSHRRIVTLVMRGIRIFLLIVTALTLLETAGVPLSALLTLSGVGGVVVGFAAKDGLSNLFSGLMLQMGEPFKEGETIRLPDRNIEGVVESIGWRVCRIRTLERRLVFVPNALFGSMMIENASRVLHRRIKTHIIFRYEDHAKIPRLLEDISAAMAIHPAVDGSQDVWARIVALTEGGIQVQLLAHVSALEAKAFFRAQQEVLQIALEKAESHHVAYATNPNLFPHSDTNAT